MRALAVSQCQWSPAEVEPLLSEFALKQHAGHRYQLMLSSTWTDSLWALLTVSSEMKDSIKISSSLNCITGIKIQLIACSSIWLPASLLSFLTVHFVGSLVAKKCSNYNKEHVCQLRSLVKQCITHLGTFSFTETWINIFIWSPNKYPTFKKENCNNTFFSP